MGEVEDLEALAYELGCKTMTLPTTYLILPLRMCRNSLSNWDRVEERFRKKTCYLEETLYFKRGRLTLIKSTLSNLSIYTMPLFHLPKGVKTRLEKIQRNFLWGGGNLERRIHLVSCAVACCSKEKRGLRI